MKKILLKIIAFNFAEIKRFQLLEDIFLLSIRLYWGFHFYQTGLGKLTNFDRTLEFFTGLHIPFPALNVYIAGGTECIGGILLMLGLGSRFISLPLIFTMIIAYLTADSEAIMNIFSNSDGFVTATPFLFMLTAIIVLIFGAGRISIDKLLAKNIQ